MNRFLEAYAVFYSVSVKITTLIFGVQSTYCNEYLIDLLKKFSYQNPYIREDVPSLP